MHRHVGRYDPKAKLRKGRRGLLIMIGVVAFLVVGAAVTRASRGGEQGAFPVSKGSNPSSRKFGGNAAAAAAAASRDPSPNSPRIALIIPFMGSHFPPYFPLFAWSAAGSASLVDFLIFHAGQLPPSVTLAAPDNVKFIDLKDAAGFAAVHARVATVLANGNPSRKDVGKLKKILTEQFRKPHIRLNPRPSGTPGSNRDLEDLWWSMTAGEGGGAAQVTTARVANVLASASDGVISSFFSSEHQSHHSKPPLLLVDLQGPSPGLSTNLIARYMEELSNCEQLFMLGQLAALGYKLNVLPGGFSLVEGGVKRKASGVCAAHDDSQQIARDAKVVIATTSDAFWG